MLGYWEIGVSEDIKEVRIESLEHEENISNEQILRWLVDFGSGWIDEEDLSGTWADAELFWAKNVDNGWLEDEQRRDKGLINYYYKLSQKALDKLKEKTNERETL